MDYGNVHYSAQSGTTEVVISTKPVRVHGIYAVSGSSGTVTLADDDTTGGANQVLVADATAFAQVDLHGMLFSKGLTYDGSVAGTSVVIAFSYYPK